MPMPYATTDLSLAAFLLARGQPLDGVSREGPRCVFSFPDAARELAPSFYASATVPARAYANALRDLKTLIRET